MDTVVSTQSLLQGYKLQETKRTRRTERGDLLDLFLNRLNPERTRSGYKPLSVAFLSRFFSERHMSVPQIYQFYRDCERANDFSKYFWYMTKVQKDEK